MPSVLPESRRMHSVDGRDYSFRNCLGRGVPGGWEREERRDAGPLLMRLQVSPAPVTKASPEAEAAPCAIPAPYRNTNDHGGAALPSGL